ncbi:MAG: hypothetical protein LW854_21185 [Rubrivivax sp.]|nr:hypothetical protein [Rubrivivax sp.]
MSGSKSSSHAGASSAEASASASVSDAAINLTVHSMPSGDQALIDQRTRTGRWKMLLVLAMCASPVIASYFTYYVIRPQGRTNYAELIQPSRSLPTSVPLRTLSGQPEPAQNLRRQWLLITLADASCGQPCEQRLYLQHQIHQMLGRERDRLDRVWLVLDEAAPSPALVKSLESGQNPARILRLARDDAARWLQPAAGQALEDHFYIVDPQGEWMMRAPANPEPQRLKRDLERLLRASSFWDTAGR